MNKEYKLGNGNRLIVHDVDLEHDNQVWYEEIKASEDPTPDFDNSNDSIISLDK